MILGLAALAAGVGRIEVNPDRVLNRISPAMYGAGMEDVNHEIYGGLYAQRLFGESFEEPAPGLEPKGWRVYGGRWSAEGNGIHIHGGDGPKLVREMPDLADGEIEAEVAVSNDLGENAGLLVRVTHPGVGADDFHGYEISLSPKLGRLILGKHRNDFASLASVPAPVIPGKWHRLRVAMSGPRIRVFLDGESEPRIDFTDHDRPLLAGRLALRTWRSDATFRNVRVQGESVPVSMAGAGVSRMWDRVLTGRAKARFAQEEGAFNGVLCQQIVHEGGDGRVGVANRGLNRWGISVRHGHEMEGRIYLRGDADAVTVALQSADGNQTYASQKLVPGKNWGQATFRLKPSATDPNARFALWIDRPGSVWADQAVLLDAPQDRYKGLPIRKDIAEDLVGSGLNFLRYGGTMVNVPGYRWKSMIGDPDRRPPYAGHWYPNSTNGFGIFEFLQFCEKAKLGASFAINVDETPKDAADLADYLTAPTTNPWGRRRAADGHPAPYQVEYIEIGNEEGIGNPDVAAMTRYAERFRLLSQAIHGRNPKLKLVCGAWWVPEAPQMKTVFDAIDGVAAAWDFHFWSDEPNAGVGIDRDLSRAEALFKSWNPATTLKAVVFEENGNRHDFQRALGHATTLNATRRHGDFVLADCAANALQPWRQNDNGWDQGGVFFTPDRAWTMPPADARRMLATAQPLRVEAKAEGGLDVLASRSQDGRTLALDVVNTGDRPVEASVALGSFAAETGQAWIFSGDLNARNLPGRPPLVPRFEPRLAVRREGFAFTFPPRSITSLRLSC
ncbi:DUF1080 domain-containing protein [bacterium]|nr:MAG: DUF1080 domain-containing protein [bacterium]